MMRIGLTGGIGSGKSVVSEILLAMGYKVYNSDIRASRLMVESPDVIKALTGLIGRNAYTQDGMIDKQVIGGFIFASEANRLAVNSIVHPAVFSDFERWCAVNSSERIVFAESAILFEAGMNTHVDRTLLVYAPVDVRISRVIRRDSLSRQQVESRISSQMPEEEKMKLVDYIINNSDNDRLLPQITHLLKIIDSEK